MKEDIKECETSKVDSGKQILLQRHETNKSSKKLKMKIDLDNTLKVLSKERQEECKSKESNKITYSSTKRRVITKV